jgi:hypothetical protein
MKFYLYAFGRVTWVTNFPLSHQFRHLTFTQLVVTNPTCVTFHAILGSFLTPPALILLALTSKTRIHGSGEIECSYLTTHPKTACRYVFFVVGESGNGNRLDASTLWFEASVHAFRS